MRVTRAVTVAVRIAATVTAAATVAVALVGDTLDLGLQGPLRPLAFATL